MSLSRSRRAVALSSLLALGALALTASPAMATKIHVLSTSFTLPGSAAPLEPAIDQSTGEVYVSSPGNGTVYAFEESGVPAVPAELTKADGSTPYPFSNPQGLAVDNSTGPNKGDIYVADYNLGNVTQFNPTGARTAQAPFTELNVPKEGTSQAGGLPPVVNNRGLNPTGVAVATNGNVYVADQSNNVVDVFEPNGNFVSQLTAGHISGPNAIALNNSGDLYVAQNGSGLVEFEPSGACVNSCASIDPPANLGVATDTEGNVYADEGATIGEFSSSGELIYSIGGLTYGRGLAFNETSGSIYVADQGAAQVDIFKSVVAPTLTIRPVTSPVPTSATLNAKVDPAGGGNVTECHFEYGTEKGSYTLGKIPCLSPSPADSEIGNPANPIESPTEVHSELTGLTTLATYHYRLVAKNAQGTMESPDHLFTLLPDLPTVSNASASSETPATATMSAEINPEFGTTVYRFQYGVTKSYGSSTLIRPVGSDGIDHLVTAGISGLTAGTTYHYRVVAINYVGTTQGPDQTFTTPEQPAVISSSAADVTSSTAILEAQINPKLAATTYHFEYGTGASYSLRTPESSSIGAGDTSHMVSADLSDLAPAATYYFRAVATNPFGSTTGLDQTFTTSAAPPTSNPPTKPCGKGLIKKHGKCVKKPHSKPRHHKRGSKR